MRIMSFCLLHTEKLEVPVFNVIATYHCHWCCFYTK